MSKGSHFSHLFIYLSRRSIFHVLLFSSIAATFSTLNEAKTYWTIQKISNQIRLMNKLDWFSFCWWKFFMHVQHFSFSRRECSLFFIHFVLFECNHTYVCVYMFGITNENQLDQTVLDCYYRMLYQRRWKTLYKN